MTLFLLNVLLAVAWGALSGDFAPVNLFFGFALGYVILWISYRKMTQVTYFRRVFVVLEFLSFFLWELLIANIRVVIIVLSPRPKLRPAVIGIPLDIQEDAAITLLVNLITLTPGTLSLDVSTDRRMLYIHSIWVQDAETFRAHIKTGYERRVKELFQ
ncbi:MAG: Na+/H+ antiporter subunit E [Anaerolineae bacterium]|nr:Na+/H+ antiporter subunit E [Anaerolineae bacterium]